MILDQIQTKLALVPIAAIERTRTKLRFRGNLIHADLFDAILLEQPDGRIQDTLSILRCISALRAKGGGSLPRS